MLWKISGLNNVGSKLKIPKRNIFLVEINYCNVIRYTTTSSIETYKILTIARFI